MDTPTTGLARWYQEYVGVLKKYAVFSGRAGRMEYWVFFLINATLGVIVSAVSGGYPPANAPLLVLILLYAIATLLPSIGVTIRRLHDTGRSAAWILVGLVPIVGSIVLIVFLATRGSSEENRYGQSVTVSALDSRDWALIAACIGIGIVGTTFIGVQAARSISEISSFVRNAAEEPSVETAGGIIRVPLGNRVANVTFPSELHVIRTPVGNVYAAAAGDFSYMAFVYEPLSGGLTIENMETSLYESLLSSPSRMLRNSMRMTFRGYPALDFLIDDSGTTDMRGRAVNVDGRMLVMVVGHKPGLYGQIQYDDFFESLAIQ